MYVKYFFFDKNEWHSFIHLNWKSKYIKYKFTVVKNKNDESTNKFTLKKI